MKFNSPFRLMILPLFLLAGVLSGRADLLPQLSAGQIVTNVMERSKADATNALRANYAYSKYVLTRELDSKDRVTETKEKVFLIQGGIGSLQSMKINGKPVSDKEMQKQNKQAIEARQKLTGSKSGKTDDNWDQFLNTDLTARYQFSFLRQELLNGRPSYVLAFSPLPGKLPVKKIVDRALNQMTGTIWIDGQEFEIAKAELCLQSKVALGGIMEILGSLKQFRYTVQRVRMDQFVWLNQKTKGEYEGRKLWDTTHIRTETESSDFHKMSAPQSVSAPPVSSPASP